MKKIFVFLLISLVLFASKAFADSQQTEEIILTTYYPAPYGVYNEIDANSLCVNDQIVGGFGAKTTGGTTNWNHSSNARSGNGYTLLMGTDSNGPGPGRYFHPFSFEYNTKDGTGNLTQFAIPYGSTAHMNSGLYMRGRYGDAWSNWMRILSEDNNGNIGIGTISPTRKLDVRGPVRIEQGSNYDVWIQGGSDTSGNGRNLALLGVKSSDELRLNHGGEYTGGVRIQGTKTIIDGNVGIGNTTNPLSNLDVRGIAEITYGGSSPDTRDYAPLGVTRANQNRDNTYITLTKQGVMPWGLGISRGGFPDGAAFIIGHAQTDKTINFPFFSIMPHGNVGIGLNTLPGYKLTVNGSTWCSSGSWSGSDKRWKKDITPLQNSLDSIMQLQGIYYNWRSDEFPGLDFSNDRQIGLIAQDVEEIIPEIVTTDNEGYKGISYEKLTPVLVEAIKSLKKDNDALRQRIDDLELCWGKNNNT